MPIVAEHPAFPCIPRKDVENITGRGAKGEPVSHTECTAHERLSKSKLEQFKDLHCLYYVILIPGKISSCKLAPVFP